MATTSARNLALNPSYSGSQTNIQNDNDEVEIDPKSLSPRSRRIYLLKTEKKFRTNANVPWAKQLKKKKRKKYVDPLDSRKHSKSSSDESSSTVERSSTNKSPWAVKLRSSGSKPRSPKNIKTDSESGSKSPYNVKLRKSKFASSGSGSRSGDSNSSVKTAKTRASRPKLGGGGYNFPQYGRGSKDLNTRPTDSITKYGTKSDVSPAPIDYDTNLSPTRSKSNKPTRNKLKNLKNIFESGGKGAANTKIDVEESPEPEMESKPVSNVQIPESTEELSEPENTPQMVETPTKVIKEVESTSDNDTQIESEITSDNDTQIESEIEAEAEQSKEDYSPAPETPAEAEDYSQVEESTSQPQPKEEEPEEEEFVEPFSEVKISSPESSEIATPTPKKQQVDTPTPKKQQVASTQPWRNETGEPIRKVLDVPYSDWESIVQPGQSIPYYHNFHTGSTQWEKPSIPTPVSASPLPKEFNASTTPVPMSPPLMLSGQKPSTMKSTLRVQQDSPLPNSPLSRDLKIYERANKPVATPERERRKNEVDSIMKTLQNTGTKSKNMNPVTPMSKSAPLRVAPQTAPAKLVAPPSLSSLVAPPSLSSLAATTVKSKPATHGHNQGSSDFNNDSMAEEFIKFAEGDGDTDEDEEEMDSLL